MLTPRMLARAARERLARMALERRPGVTIDDTAKVIFSRLLSKPPKELCIGAGSIIECTIIADRPSACVSIGANTFIGNSSIISATSVTVGDDVLVSWGCTIVDHHSHSLVWEYRRNDVRDWYHGRKNWSSVRTAPIRIENKAWLGFNTIVLAGVTIGEGAVIGCGSIVTRDVPPYSVAVGSPARVVNKDVRSSHGGAEEMSRAQTPNGIDSA